MAKERDQQKDVLAYLQKYGTITQLDAYREFPAPITRLAAVICNLRKQGYDIETRDCVRSNCYGTRPYAMYVYHGREDEIDE